MTTLPANEVTMEDLVAWQDLHAQLAKIKAAEMLLRKKIYGGMFADPAEGTNTTPLAEGWVLKGKRVINRKVDLPVLQAYAVIDGPLQKVGIRADDLIEWKPELKIREYRTLTEEQRTVFDMCLTISDGSPSIEIVLPASAKKASAA